MFEGVIGYIIGGAVIGILARFFKPGADPMGWILTILLGIAGAVVGVRLAAMLGLGSTIMIWVCAIISAIVLLFIYEAIRKKTAKTA
ncbi:GlsB/YeaQ/YmgE family stress response membrane protein [Lysobacter tyrosinilyticus]